MKIVNIFGLVVAVHVAVLVLIFAIPGCRTSSKNPDAAMGATMEPAAPVTGYDTTIDSAPARDLSADLNPPLAPRGASSNDPVISLGGGSTRQSPTRPGAAPAGTTITPAPQITEAPAQAYTVGRGDSLWSIAKKHGVTVRELAAANNLRADASLQVNQKLTIPSSAPAPATVSASGTSAPSTAATRPSAAGPSTAEAITYEVRSGDTLGGIARRHNTTINAIKTLNKMRGDMVRIGDKILVPPAGGTPAATAATPATNAPAPAAATPSPAPALARAGGNSMKHVVAAGESLNEIARRYGVRIGDIALANNIADPARIRPGQELVIPGATAPAAARTPEPTRYTPSYQQPASSTPAPSTAPPETPATSQQQPTGTINTSEPDEVPVIRVEEPEQTIRIEPEPSDEPRPPLFN